MEVVLHNNTPLPPGLFVNVFYCKRKMTRERRGKSFSTWEMALSTSAMAREPGHGHKLQTLPLLAFKSSASLCLARKRWGNSSFIRRSSGNSIIRKRQIAEGPREVTLSGKHPACGLIILCSVSISKTGSWCPRQIRSPPISATPHCVAHGMWRGVEWEFDAPLKLAL